MSAPEITDEHAGNLAALVRQGGPANAWAGEKLVAAGRDLQGKRVASSRCTPKAEERGAKAAKPKSKRTISIMDTSADAAALALVDSSMHSEFMDLVERLRASNRRLQALCDESNAASEQDRSGIRIRMDEEQKVGDPLTDRINWILDNHPATKVVKPAPKAEGPRDLPVPDYQETEAAYLGTDYQLIPLHKPGERGRDGRDRSKSPRDSAWQGRHYDSAEVLATCKAEGRNVGERIKQNQLIIDVDPRNGGDESFKRLCADSGLDPKTCPRVITGSGGSHFRLKRDPAFDIPKSNDKYPGIDFLSHEGHQAVAAGSVHPNGKHYRLDPNHPPLAAAPMMPAGLVAALVRKPKEKKPKDTDAAPLVTPDQLPAILAVLSVKKFDTGQTWREIIYAVHAATKGDRAALKHVQDWSAGDAERWPNGRADAADVWDRADAERPDGITAATLFKALKDAGRGDLIPVDPDLAEMNRLHAVMPIGNKTCVVTFEDDGVSIKRAQSFENFAQLENRYRHEYVNAEGERKSVPRGTWWLNQRNRRQHDGGRKFMPDRDERVVGDTLNTWTGFAVVPRKPDGKSGAAGSRLFLNHGLKVICSGNEEHFDYEIKRRAWIGQRRLRSEIAGVYRSDAEGSGKGIWLRGNGHLYGRHHMQVNSAEHVAGKHNEHLETLVSLTADEALFASDPRHRNALYGLITEPDLTIEPKFIGAYSAPNRLNIDISSNARHVVPASNTARRMFVPTVSEDRVGDLEYFRQIDAELREGGYEALLYHLLHEVDVRDFDPRRVPKTAGLAEQAAYSRKGVDRLVEEWINDGRLPFCHPSKPHIIITSGEEDGRGFDHFIRNKAPDDLRRLGPLQVKNELRRAWGSAHWSSRVKYQQCAGIVMPALSELRAKFEAKHGPQDWRCDATEWGGSDDAIPF